LADRKAVYAWAAASESTQGPANLIFNNAGVALGSQIDGMSEEDFRWIMDINFWGVVYRTQAFLPQLKASGEGHVINISSLFGLIAVPSQGAYNASKFAVRGFTEALRQELELAGEPVSATTVHPGGIKTNIARAARWGQNMSRFLGQDAEAGRADFEKMFKTTPAQAADTILKGVRRNARRVLIGLDARAGDLLQRLMPTGYQKLLTLATRRQMGRRS
jgi:butyryl-CoA dehydrogenase